MEKTIRIGETSACNGRKMSIYCKIKLIDGKLSITGVEGPLPNGNALGSCGQIVMSEWNIETYAPGWDAEQVYRLREVWGKWHLNDMRPNCEHQTGPEWDTSRELTIYHFRILDHVAKEVRKTEKIALAAIKNGQTFTPTPEQTALSLLPSTTKSHLPKPPEHYEPNGPQYSGDHYNKRSETKTAGWVYPSEHPDGILTKPCPVCGYKYGSAWLREELPQDVIDFLGALPETDTTPAWI